MEPLSSGVKQISSESPIVASAPSPSEAPVRVRLGLQQRAPANLRRHMQRAVVRFLVLVIGDIGSFGVMRGLLRAVRDQAVLGTWVAGQTRGLMPPGILNGWQFAVALLVGLLVTGNYGQGDNRRDPWRLFLACALATALPLWMTIWSRGLDVVLVQYALTVSLVWAGVVAERLVVDRLVSVVRKPGRDAADTLFVGPGLACLEAAASPIFASGQEYQTVGFVDVHAPPTRGALGHIGNFSMLLAASGAEVVVVCGHVSAAQFQHVVDAALAGGCQVLSMPPAMETPGVEPAVVWRGGSPLLQLTAPSLKGQQVFLKRMLDLVGALVGLVALSPVYAFVAALVRMDSPGPVFFRQKRVGRGGRLFSIYKFRTMRRGAEQERDGLLEQSIYDDPRLFKIPGDPRITQLGRWLRRTSLDELPQLWNVLRGEMSLVGPRPPLPSEVELYEEHHYARFDVKPGITGPWQVAGRNQITDFEEVIALETEYIRGWSIWKDVAILWRTLWVVVDMRGAH